MAAEYMHVGIPVLNKKPNMVYNDWGKFWVNESVDAYDFKIEYLKFDEGTIFPEILSKQPHVAYSVDNIFPGRSQHQGSPCICHLGRRHHRALRRQKLIHCVL